MFEILDQLKDTNGEGVRVAIVDSGVDATHSWIGRHLVQSYVVDADEDGRPSIVESAPDDVNGHGTAVAGQVRRIASNAELVSVRILGASRTATSEALITALEWLADQDVHVVNMSLSTMRAALALRICHAIDDLCARGTACVSARLYNKYGRNYPSSFASTVGVCEGRMPTGKLRFREGELVEIEASGVDVEVAWKGGQIRTVTGSSYACPIVCGIIARMLSVNPGLRPYEIKSLLRALALRQEDGWWEPWMNGVTPA